MAVFDVNANQVLAQPVSGFYQGKALRAGIKAQELQNQALEDEIENAPATRATAMRKAALDEANILQQMQKRAQEIGLEETKRMANAYGPILEKYEAIAESDGDDAALEFANKEIPLAVQSLGEEHVADFQAVKGEDGVLSHEEIARLGFAVKPYYERTGQSKRQQAEFLGPDGTPMQGFFNPDTGQYFDSNGNEIKGAKPIAPQATQSELGPLGGTGDKVTDRKTREVHLGTENLLSSIDRVEKQIGKMDQSALGLPGSTSKLVDNIANAVIGFVDLMPTAKAQIGTGDMAQEVADSALLDANLYKDMFEGPAAQSAALQANAVGLAYAIARSANPDGRISDADVRHQIGRLNLDVSSKSQILSAIGEVKREVMVNMANYIRVNRLNQNEEGKSYYDSLMERVDAIDGPPQSKAAAPAETTIVNPKTGEILVLRNGQWVKP